MQFYSMKRKGAAEGDAKDTTMSVVLGGKSLLIYDITDPDSPVELAFQPQYGNIVSYRWFGEGYIVLGFESSFVVVMVRPAPSRKPSRPHGAHGRPCIPSRRTAWLTSSPFFRPLTCREVRIPIPSAACRVHEYALH